jgi:hypothetical protein
VAAFTDISEAQSRLEDLPISVCAVLLAEACNIDVEPLVRGDNPELTRRRILVQLNRGEICTGYRKGQEGQITALGLVTNAVVLWNTLYMEAALERLRAEGFEVRSWDLARLAPGCSEAKAERSLQFPWKPPGTRFLPLALHHAQRNPRPLQ